MKAASKIPTYLLGILLALGAASPAFSKDAVVSRVQTSVAPSQPTAGSAFTVSTRLFGTTGKPCITNVTATVAGSSQTRNNVRIHSGQPAGLTFSFSLANLTGGTSLTPTITWNGCGNGSSNTISGGGTPPTVQPSPTPALNITKSLSGSGKQTVSPGDVVTYKLTYSSTGTDEAPTVILTDTLDSDLQFLYDKGVVYC